MLFLLFINDIPDVLSDGDSMSLYDDDAKLFRTIKSLDDCAHLQETLSKSEQWSQEANINFNASKCKVLTISRRKSPFLFNYHLGSTDLSRVNKEIDLGISYSYLQPLLGPSYLLCCG